MRRNGLATLALDIQGYASYDSDFISHVPSQERVVPSGRSVS